MDVMDGMDLLDTAFRWTGIIWEEAEEVFEKVSSAGAVSSGGDVVV
jgi:hypothetical protein